MRKMLWKSRRVRKILFKTVRWKSWYRHVRWATHGVPNVVNAHHSSEIVSVVHNGIIENSDELKELEQKD